MGRRRPGPEPDADRLAAEEEARQQIIWAQYIARVAGLLRKPDDPLKGGPSAEDYERLDADELRALAEKSTTVRREMLKHLDLAAEAEREAAIRS